ncbi:MAG: AAA family ATPase [Muribaculaceae bacterium]|nr:AAA family ATPase [Muribaculaceae bacterium]
MSRTLTFKNYRIFAEQQQLTLAPVTVVFGKNNVGKSALLKLPVMVNGILQYDGNGELFGQTYNGLNICKEYRDVVYGKASRAVELTIAQGDSAISLKFFVEPTGKVRTHLEEINGKPYDGIPLAATGELPAQLRLDIEYLKAIRDIPRDGFFMLADSESETRSGGIFAWRRLAEDVLNNNGNLLKTVSQWYARTFDGWEIDVDQSRNPIFSLTMRHDKFLTNIIDGGAGIAQSLPVIVSAATHITSPRLYIYEEPETHLHPEAHGEMAEFIARQAASSKGLKTFFIETHSINFILRLRTLVALGKLPLDYLALYFVNFDPSTHSSSVNRVTVNPDGTVKGWPADVFQETLAESLALRRAQLKKEGDER